MKFLPFMLALIICANPGRAQEYFHKKVKIKKVAYNSLIRDGIDTIRIAADIKSNGSRHRTVTLGDDTFIFSYNTNTQQDQILDRNGQLLATMQSFFDVTTKEGTRFTVSRQGSNEWSYMSNGEEIVKAKFMRFGTDKGIEITYVNTSVPGHKMLQLMALLYGLDVIKAKAQQPALYILPAIAIAILGAMQSQ